MNSCLWVYKCMGVCTV